jgi:hypothetical protein
MAIINGSNGAVYLQPRTGTQLLEGNINGYAALGNGEYAAVYGPGPYAFSIIVTGDIQSGGASSLDGGIVLGGPGIITNQGTIEGGAGILVNGYAYGGATYLQNSGLIIGRVGSGVYTYGRGGVNNTGRITGGSNGIFLAGGGVVTNAGSISGGTGVADGAYYGNAYVANAGSINGTSTDGVFALGTVVNDATGIITGAEVGVNLYGGGTLTNTRGFISGGTTGVAIAGYGNGYGDFPAAVKNAGTIAGGASGIGIDLSHTLATNIYNQSGGVITGQQYGIVQYVNGGAYSGASLSHITIGNAGTIAAEGAATIQGSTSTYSYVPAGAAGSGIVLEYGQLINTGTITGANGVFSYGYDSIYNSNRIAGTENGVVLAAFANATNKGVITGGTSGIDIGTLNQRSYILNETGGRITGGDYGIATYPVGSHDRYVSIGNAGYIGGGVTNTASLGLAGYNADSGIVAGFARIINTGTIAGGATGIVADNDSYILNTNQVRGGATGINLDDNGTVINQGFIKGGSAAIRANFGASITNTKGAVIAGGEGIEFVSFDSSLTNAGTITASSGPAITGYYGVKIFNTGQISSPGTAGAISFSGGAAVYNYAAIGGGVTLGGSYGGGYLYNTGKIIAAGTQTGVDLAAPGYMINDTGGTITGAIGVKLAKNTALYNYGAISGGVTATGNAAVYSYAGGSITGTVDGVFLAAGTVGVYGGLISGATYAVAFGTHGSNLLEIAPTATLIGGAYLGGGGIALLAGSTAGTLTTAAYKDFTAITIESAADWHIAGSLAATELVSFTGAADTLSLDSPSLFAATIEKFSTADTIDLTGISLSSITATQFAGGVLTLTETSGSLTLTFANPGSFGTDTFSLFADGANTGITLSAPTTLAANQNTPGWLNNNFVPTPSSAISLVTLQA